MPSRTARLCAVSATIRIRTSTSPSRSFSASRRSRAWTSRQPSLRLASRPPAVEPDTASQARRSPAIGSGTSVAHACTGGQHRPEPLEEPELCGVAHRIAVRIEPGAEAEPDRQPGAADLLEGEVRELAALDPAELRLGHPGRGADDGLAQAVRDARLADFLAELPREPRREAATLDRWIPSGRHGPSMAMPASPALNWGPPLACRALQRRRRPFGSRGEHGGSRWLRFRRSARRASRHEVKSAASARSASRRRVATASRREGAPGTTRGRARRGQAGPGERVADVEQVADALERPDAAGLAGRRAELAADARHPDAEVAEVLAVFGAPDLGQQLAVEDDACPRWPRGG